MNEKLKRLSYLVHHDNDSNKQQVRFRIIEGTLQHYTLPQSDANLARCRNTKLGLAKKKKIASLPKGKASSLNDQKLLSYSIRLLKNWCLCTATMIFLQQNYWRQSPLASGFLTVGFIKCYSIYSRT